LAYPPKWDENCGPDKLSLLTELNGCSSMSLENEPARIGAAESRTRLKNGPEFTGFYGIDSK
jgi:hypothetical protein